MEDSQITEWIAKWQKSGGAERANYQLFLTELCDVLGVPHPDPTRAEEPENAYVFEKNVVFNNHDGTNSTKRVDLYRRGCFVCETKQGVEAEDDEQLLSTKSQEARKKRKAGHGKRGTAAFDDTMLRAKAQAEQYARNLPTDEGRPPFLMVIDVGHTIELHAEFSQTGGVYTPFPDPVTYRIRLADLAKPEVREQLALVWTDPHALDPAKRAAKVTREIAAKLAELAKSLEACQHNPQDVAQFLMRCLFTMFAEDVGLLDRDSFKELLKKITDPAGFVPTMEELWRSMNIGGFSVSLNRAVKRFNGGLFAESRAIPLTRDQLNLLIEAAEKSWNDVEPAIFGTLLERALDPVERHKLGAHYTPRAYVERLVIPTVVEPLREEWDAARTAAVTLAKQGDTAGAVKELERFHDRLCEVRVLDPACGSGNFLYVTLEHLKRIEGEVFAAYESIAHRQMTFEESHTVDPHQLLGIEINPRAAAIAELVLWIGYLQWHYRTRGKVSPPEPIIKDFKNIECRDAVLSWSSTQIVLDENNKPVTRWDGRTTKPHPVTGEEVPDETARIPIYTYLNPKKAEWPKAEFVVGNPPFVGNKRMRFALGDGYVDAIREAYSDELSSSIDFVMYWWHTAALLVKHSKIRRFGFITTNSITQPFNRRVVETVEGGDSGCLVFAISDHPWVDSSVGAAVRIAMTVVDHTRQQGILATVADEEIGEGDDSIGCTITYTSGQINSDLTVGVKFLGTIRLDGNFGLSNQGVTPLGTGFRLEPDELADYALSPRKLPKVVRPYLIGRDIVQIAEPKFIIDFFGMSRQQSQEDFPLLFQRVVDRVKPERDQKKRDSYRDKWWIFAEPRSTLRLALDGLPRYIATCRTAKHRVFTFVEGATLPDAKIVAIALDNAFYLGTLSSRIHVSWAMATGGWLGVGNDSNYNHSDCLGKFPFPNASDAQKAKIRELGEQLDAHRKRQQELHPTLTMTGMYNVLEKLRAGEALNAKEKTIHEQGLVSVLKQIHDDLDAAVADAYGWPVDLSDEEILERLVALNHERAEEERRGIIRYLRPEFQNPQGQTQKQIAVEEEEEPKKKGKAAKAKPAKKLAWPKALSDQAAAVQSVLVSIAGPASEEDVAKRFTRANKDRVAELLDTLTSLGKARELEDGRFLAV